METKSWAVPSNHNLQWVVLLKLWLKIQFQGKSTKGRCFWCSRSRWSNTNLQNRHIQPHCLSWKSLFWRLTAGLQLVICVLHFPKSLLTPFVLKPQTNIPPQHSKGSRCMLTGNSRRQELILHMWCTKWCVNYPMKNASLPLNDPDLDSLPAEIFWQRVKRHQTWRSSHGFGTLTKGQKTRPFVL